LPDTPERVQQELTLQLALSMALLATKGYAAPEVGRAGTRARELCQQLGETPQLFPVLFRLLEFYLNRGDLQTAHELAKQQMRLAQSVHDPYPLSVAHVALGATLSWLGELVSARLHVEQALALYDPQPSPGLTSTTADPRLEGLTPERAPWLSYRWASNTADPRIECLSYLAAWSLWQLGYPDQALKRSQEVLTLAEGLSQPLGLAYASGIAAWCHQLCREEQVTQEWAEAVMTLATEQGFPFWLAFGTMLRGWALAEQGQAEEGIPQIRQGLAAFRATEAELICPYWLALLAEAYGKGGQVEEGLAVLTEALAAVEKNEERQHEAELYRLKGTLTLQSQVESHKSKVEEAEECFLKAIEIARHQQAKSWELRAVMSLSGLWRQQGKKEEARQMLSEIYNWFTEGFDTKDLQEAKALLTELKTQV
jgi:predicted ATPase